MKTKYIFTIICFITSISIYSQKNLAEVNKINGIYIFTDSKPVEDYDVLGEIKADESDKDIRISGAQYTSVRDNLINNSRLANYNVEGLILNLVNGGTEKAIMIKFKNKERKNSIAKVEQYQGIYIFTDCTPISSNNYIQTVNFYGSYGSGQYSNVRDILIKKAKRKYPDTEGIILKLVSGGKDLGDLVKFN